MIFFKKIHAYVAYVIKKSKINLHIRILARNPRLKLQYLELVSSFTFCALFFHNPLNVNVDESPFSEHQARTFDIAH